MVHRSVLAIALFFGLLPGGAVAEPENYTRFSARFNAGQTTGMMMLPVPIVQTGRTLGLELSCQSGQNPLLRIYFPLRSLEGMAQQGMSVRPDIGAIEGRATLRLETHRKRVSLQGDPTLAVKTDETLQFSVFVDGDPAIMRQIATLLTEPYGEVTFAFEARFVTTRSNGQRVDGTRRWRDVSSVHKAPYTFSRDTFLPMARMRQICAGDA